jgi:PAS domain S-box-containing protein
MRRRHARPLSFPGFDEGDVFRSIFGAHPDAMLLVDATGVIVMSNPAAEALLGYGADELAGIGVDALVPTAIRGRHASYREAYGEAPRSRPMGDQTDLAALRKDGSEVRVEIALSPLQQHGLPFVVASIRDIGEYPRVKKALRQARYSEHLAQLARLAVDERDPDALLAHAPRITAEALQLPSAIVHLLEDGGRQFRVAAGVGMLPGLPVGARTAATPDSPPGQMLVTGRTVVHSDYSSDAAAGLHSRFRDAGLVCGAAAPLSDRGRVFGALAVHADRPHSFGPDEIRFLESVCGLLATSLQRARTEEALNHSQRLESVGQLTGGIAHDFNNLLTVIQGNLQILETLPALAADGRGQKLLDAATRGTRRAAELTSKLLAFSRRQVLQPNPVDIGAMLNSLADMLRRTLDQRVHITIDVEVGCPAVLADPVQLESALLNVAINARDAMPDGGELAFRARRTAALPDIADAATAPPGDASGFVSIAVSDTGTGMPEAVRERAFEPFFTTKGAGRGTGLGLSTVYGFATQSGGTVTLDSAPGAGTTVTMLLPQPGAVAAPVAEEPASVRVVPRGLRVLLVEDDSAVRAVALEFLEALGAHVTACVNGEEALATIDAGTEFDLLLSDIALGPGMRGTELARKAQERRPRLAVLLVSGFSAELIDVDRVAPPDWALLPKPYSRNDLSAAIATALGTPDA